MHDTWFDNPLPEKLVNERVNDVMLSDCDNLSYIFSRNGQVLISCRIPDSGIQCLKLAGFRFSRIKFL